MLLLVVIFFGGLTLIMYGEWQKAIQQEADFDTIALTVEGTIIERNIRRERSTNGSSSTIHEVRYYFDSIVGSGVDLVYAEQEVSRDFYDSVKVQDSVPVQFMPENPEISRVEDRDEDRTMFFVTMGLGLFTLLFVGVLIRVVFVLRKQAAAEVQPLSF